MDPDSDDAIAVVGVACKFPGAKDIDEFWRVLVNGENHVIEIPKDRWNSDAFYSSDKSATGKSYVKHAGFIDRLNEWDNRFFQINDDEAARMDPQQYVLLECTYRALENGGFPVDKLSGMEVGCYIGVMSNDYGNLISADVKERDNYTVTGAAISIIANRLSFALNLTGPSLCVDTACSSSLMGIHLGSQGIRSGDCEMAICGGVNILLDPKTFISLCRANMVSPTGLCQPFSANADGYARGEGCGVVILKSLRKAISDGDRIWGIIGTGCNQDGHFATPITAPSSKQQEQLLHKVYTKYNVDPCDVTYIEAHGTGTPVGDPIEASSLGNFIGKARKPGASPCYMGSVKSNIAHLESAAGVAGLIKVLLMIKNRTIAPTIHFDKPNSRIDLEDLQLQIPTRVSAWETEDGRGRLACVNSFGFGGSNAHAIVREYVDPRESKPILYPVIAISAKSKASMKLSLQNLKNVLKNRTNDLIDDLSYTSTVRRAHYRNYRFATHGTSSASICQILEKEEKAIDSKQPLNTVRPRRIIFVFPGMGTDWEGMGHDLFTKESSFRVVIEEIDGLLSKYTDQSLVDVIAHGGMALGPMKQVAIFAIEVALHHLWVSWGIKPDAIIGHSVGEVAAAYAAGKLDLQTAVKIIFYRSQFLQRVSGGGMAAVGNTSAEKVDEYCQAVDRRVEIAANNSPTSFTLSGDEDAITVIENLIANENQQEGTDIFFRRLNVSTAFHSHRVQPICNDFLNSINPLETPDNGEFVEIYSTVTGRIATESDFNNCHYWKRNIRQPVRFFKAMEAALREDTENIVVEVGPKPALQRNVKEIASDYSCTVLTSMRENNGHATMLDTLCQLYQLGVQVDWDSYHKHAQRVPIDQPVYQFNRGKHWYEPEPSRQYRMGISTDSQVNYQFVSRVSADEMTYRCNMNRSDFPFVFDHRVGGSIVVPGVVHAELALQACLSSVGNRGQHYCRLSIDFLKPLMLTEEKDVFVRLEPRGADSDSYSFKVDCGEITTAEGHVTVSLKTDAARCLNISEIKSRCIDEIEVKKIYDFLGLLGFSYGPNIRPLSKCWKNDEEALVMLILPEELSDQLPNTCIHPTIFDGMLQTTAVASFQPNLDENDLSVPAFPIKIGNVEVYGKFNSRVFVYTRVIKATEFLVSYNAIAMNESGEVVAECRDIITKLLDENESKVVGQLTYEMEWYELDSDNVETPGHKSEDIETNEQLPRCIIFADSKGIAKLLAKFVSGLSRVIECSSTHRDDVNHILQSLQKEISACRRIFYMWSIDNDREKTSDDDLYDRITSICCALKSIVKFLAQNGATCPLTVVTHGVQGTPNGTEGSSLKSLSDLTGAPVWGMIRCMLRESTYDETTLIDLSEGTLEEVATMACLSFESQAVQCSEYAICGSSVFSNRMKRVKIDEGYFKKRAIGVQPDVPIEVTSNLADSVKTLKLQYTGKDVSNIPSVKSVRVRLTKARLHDAEVFHVTSTGLSLKGQLPWSNHMIDGHPVLGIDFLGEIVSSNCNISQGTKVHICYPMKICSVTNVPESLVVKLSELPKWIQGTPCLSLLVIIWEVLVAHVNEYPKRQLIIEATMKYTHLSDLFSSYARKCGFREIPTDYASHIDDSIANGLEPSVFLNLGNLSHRSSQWVLNNLPIGSVFVSVINGADPSIQCLGTLRPDMKFIAINTNQVFQARHLERVLPQVVKWLKKLSSKHRLETLKANEFSIAQSESSAAVPTLDEESICVLSMDFKGLVHSDVDHLFHKNACYLVVGGAKGLGLEICQYMSERGAGYIAILSRSRPEKTKPAELSKVEMRGTRLLFLQADVSDTKALEKALHHLRKQLGGIPIKGVFHGAVVLADRLLINMSDEEFITATRPKILGAWNLHQLTRDDPLDYFVMHSSTVSVLGNRGQANYGAGNAFLDQLAQYRRSKGLPGQTINWSALNIGVIDSGKDVKKMLAKMGYLPLQVADIRRCFEYAIKYDPRQVLFGEFQWSRISQDLQRSEFAHIRGRFENFIDTRRRNIDAVVESTIPEKVMLHSSSPHETSAHDLVKEDIANVLAIETEQILEDVSLVALGLDSMQAMTMQTHLKKKSGVNVPIALLLTETVTVSNISQYIDDHMGTGVTLKESTAETVNTTSDVISGRVFDDQAGRFHRTMETPPDATNNMYATFCLHGIPTTEKLWRDLLHHLMQQHPMLRAKYRRGTQPGDPFDVMYDIYPDCQPDVRLLPGVRNDAEAVIAIKNASRVPFDLENEFSIRICLAKINNLITHVGFVLNHISCDFSSFAMLMREFRHVLIALARQNTTQLREVFDIRQYYAERSQVYRSQESTLMQYWQEIFETPLDFFPGRFSLMMQELVSVEGSCVSLEIDQQIAANLKAFSQKLGITQFHVTIAIYAMLLHIYSQSNDIVVCYPVDMRMHVNAGVDVIGCFINNALLRASFRDKEILTIDFLKEVGAMAKSGMYHSLYPLPRVSPFIEVLGGAKAPNMNQHYITWEEHTAFQEVRDTDVVDGVEYVDGGIVDIRQMTRIEVIRNTNKGTLQLEGCFNTSYLTDQEGLQFFSDYTDLLKTCVSESHLSLNDVISKYKSRQEIGKVQGSLESGHRMGQRDTRQPDFGGYDDLGALDRDLPYDENVNFLIREEEQLKMSKLVEEKQHAWPELEEGVRLAKRTSKGYKYKTQLCIQRCPITSKKFLTWQSNGRERRIPLHDVAVMKIYKFTDCCILEIKADKRTLTFEGLDSDKLLAWANELKERLL